MGEKNLYTFMLSVHGLTRGRDPELGAGGAEGAKGNAKGKEMATIERYTNRALGAIDGLGSRIRLCPRCGRAGVERHTAGGRIFVHAESSELLSDGLLVVPLEACPLDTLPFDVSHPHII